MYFDEVLKVEKVKNINNITIGNIRFWKRNYLII